jgi:formamidopyrimidine-DNA glycosylase
MPELPEVECLRRSLEPHLLGRTVTYAALLRRNICEVFSEPRRRRATPADLLEGHTILQLQRRGKQLAIISKSGAVLCVHLGMTGQLLFQSPCAPRSPSALAEGVAESSRPGAAYGPGNPRNQAANSQTAERKSHIHALWHLSDSHGPIGQLFFRDPRRFGGLWTFPSLAALLEHRWCDLGPDALTVTADQLAFALSNSRRAIKAAMLDQSVLAGVGNIYADEALFIAGIRPRRLASALKPAHIDTLAKAIRETLERSIQTGGSTLRDYRDANGQAGSSQLTHAVYGRAGEPCIRCGRTLASAQVAQRTTVWCPGCQQ